MAPGDSRVLGWIQEAIQEGDRIVKSDPSYDKIERAMQYISGEGRRQTADQPSYLPRVQVNRTAKATLTHVSALTDLRPVYAFRTGNPHFQSHAHLINQQTVAWWTLRMVDLELGEGIKYALAGGTGDFEITYDPDLPRGGDILLRARDPRDTLPIRPSATLSPQDWEGVVFRDAYTPNVLRGMYPDYAGHFTTAGDGFVSRVMGRFRTMRSKIVSPADTLSGLSTTVNKRVEVPTIDLYRIWLKDRSKNWTSAPILMGKPGTNWCYVVQPGEPLYPQGRLLIATDNAVIYDDAAPYWHGMFPLARLKLLSVPWQFLGLPLFNDLMPLQDAIDDTVNDFLLNLKQWTHRGVKYDENQVPRSLMERFDPRKPNWRVNFNSMAGMGAGVQPMELQDGPNLPPWSMEFLQMLIQLFDDRSGAPNLAMLMQLQQMPGADTIETYQKAMTPEIRHESRMIEACLRDVAEMVKSNMFQFYSTEKRLAMLGDIGVTLADLDMDPGSLVPAMDRAADGENYIPELDAGLDRDKRARYFLKLFQFYCAPHSILAIESQEEEMKALQLARMGYLDFWTMHEKLHTPNVGSPPPMPLPPVETPPEDVILQAAQQSLTSGAAASMGVVAPPSTIVGSNGQSYIPDPMTGSVLQVRVPTTITERLMAQMMLGIGMTGNPAGRKASGQESPKLEEKKDSSGASRTTMTESRK
jgi:hypothetical protein